jgi:hypothetical protein
MILAQIAGRRFPSRPGSDLIAAGLRADSSRRSIAIPSVSRPPGSLPSLAAGIQAPPALAGGQLFVSSDDGALLSML